MVGDTEDFFFLRGALCTPLPSGIVDPQRLYANRPFQMDDDIVRSSWRHEAY